MLILTGYAMRRDDLMRLLLKGLGLNRPDLDCLRGIIAALEELDESSSTGCV